MHHRFCEQKKGKSLKEAIDDKRQEAEGEASCDYALHLTLNEWNDDVAEELGEIVKKETCSFKLYTAYDMMLDDGQIYEIFSRVKELGGIVGVHCENHGIVQSRLKELEKTKGRTDIADYSWIHPKEAEAEAVGRILKIAKCADVPVIIVNLSTAAGYREILKAREIGQTVYVETCPEYLLLNEEKYALAAEEARKYVTVPPLRKQKNSDILWDALKEGRIQTIASDHFGFTKEQKNAGEEDFMLTPSGMPGAEERPALMWQFGVNEGKITAEQMCAYLSENPAKLFKLYPWKGALIPGMMTATSSYGILTRNGRMTPGGSSVCMRLLPVGRSRDRRKGRTGLFERKTCGRERKNHRRKDRNVYPSWRRIIWCLSIKIMNCVNVCLCQRRFL